MTAPDGRPDAEEFDRWRRFCATADARREAWLDRFFAMCGAKRVTHHERG